MKIIARALALSALLTLSFTSAGSSAPLVNAPPSSSADTQLEWSVDPTSECCKICTTGKACGNSCISRAKDCHQPPGCACDG